jgi:hypothetical protein
MERTTQGPPTSPGDGRGEGVPKRSSPSAERNDSKPAVSPQAEPKAVGSGADLLAADGSSIPIGGGEGQTMQGVRDLGRSAAESLKKLSAAAEETARRNPTRAALAALAVGLVVGAAIGALLARD